MTWASLGLRLIRSFRPRLHDAPLTLGFSGRFRYFQGESLEPGPTQRIRWGDQTWEEMMLGWITFMIPEADGPKQAGDEQVLAEPRAFWD